MVMVPGIIVEGNEWHVAIDLARILRLATTCGSAFKQMLRLFGDAGGFPKDAIDLPRCISTYAFPRRDGD